MMKGVELVERWAIQNNFSSSSPSLHVCLLNNSPHGSAGHGWIAGHVQLRAIACGVRTHKGCPCCSSSSSSSTAHHCGAGGAASQQCTRRRDERRCHGLLELLSCLALGGGLFGVCRFVCGGKEECFGVLLKRKTTRRRRRRNT